VTAVENVGRGRREHPGVARRRKNEREINKRASEEDVDGKGVEELRS
jgi:hypothetical protein